MLDLLPQRMNVHEVHIADGFGNRSRKLDMSGQRSHGRSDGPHPHAPLSQFSGGFITVALPVGADDANIQSLPRLRAS